MSEPDFSQVEPFEIRILKWQKFNARPDIKMSSWFRFEHNFHDKPEFDSFTHSDLAVWVYLLCLASKTNNENVKVYPSHAQRLGKISPSQLLSTIEKLNKIEAIATLDVHPRTHTYAAVTSTYADVRIRALQDKTVHHKTEQDRTLQEVLVEKKGYPDDFNLVWEKYGRRGDKKAAFHAWKDLKLSDKDSLVLNSAIEKYVAANEWKFRKHLCRFLKSEWRELEQAPSELSQPGLTGQKETLESSLQKAKERLQERFGATHETK